MVQVHGKDTEVLMQVVIDKGLSFERGNNKGQEKKEVKRMDT